MTDPGELQHRVELLRQTTTVNPQTGERTQEWTVFAKVWARFQPVSGKEFMAGHAVQNEITARTKMWFRDDVGPENRLRFRGKTYNIEVALPDDDTGLDHMNLMCSEVGSAER